MTVSPRVQQDKQNKYYVKLIFPKALISSVLVFSYFTTDVVIFYTIS